MLVFLRNGPSVQANSEPLPWVSAPPLEGYREIDFTCGLSVNFPNVIDGSPVRLDRGEEFISFAPATAVAMAREGDTVLAAGDNAGLVAAKAEVYVFASFDRCKTFERLAVLPTSHAGMSATKVVVTGDEFRIEVHNAERRAAPDAFVWKPLRGLPWPFHRHGGAYLSRNRGRTWSME
ncbi:MAG: hypothetical protein JNM17_19925 [Archangium sp.]|nr:hypothetical protein [Archangium sp.]